MQMRLESTCRNVFEVQGCRDGWQGQDRGGGVRGKLLKSSTPISISHSLASHRQRPLGENEAILRWNLILPNLMALFHCMVRHGTVRYGSLLGGFPLGTVPGTWYFFSTTSVEVPCKPYRYQNVTCKLCWSLNGRRKSSLLRHWTCDTRPSSTALPARFKSAQPAKDRTQLLFKQTHIFASTTK